MTPTPPGGVGASGVGIAGMATGMMASGVVGSLPGAPFGMAGYDSNMLIQIQMY